MIIISEYTYLCLTDLLDQDLSSNEYFNTLPNSVRQKLLQDDEVNTFEDLQHQAAILKNNLE